MIRADKDVLQRFASLAKVHRRKYADFVRQMVEEQEKALDDRERVRYEAILKARREWDGALDADAAEEDAKE